jgi:hypothetical protein
MNMNGKQVEIRRSSRRGVFNVGMETMNAQNISARVNLKEENNYV